MAGCGPYGGLACLGSALPSFSFSCSTRSHWPINSFTFTCLRFASFISRQEDLLLSLPQTEEVAVIYSGGCLARAGRMRRIPFSAKKLEAGVLRFPVSRSRLKTCKKQSFNSCGEATNFQQQPSAAWPSALQRNFPWSALKRRKRS